MRLSNRTLSVCIYFTFLIISFLPRQMKTIKMAALALKNFSRPKSLGMVFHIRLTQKSYAHFWCMRFRRGWRMLLIDFVDDFNNRETIRHEKVYPTGLRRTRYYR
ncbi:hypothetical protein SGGMMB4_04091 [Sodalis glossinidius str. 'morsitans']|uniref:Uncharacterized protein n=1 Tax=Sodalis glossinidius (strain morsitans) TaxID=343509 RepID=A0A193QLF1_SODGM|nr:hypothetical protein SGGMMB4_04091 [Sodalis glossinidius str. 'morsitans']